MKKRGCIFAAPLPDLYQRCGKGVTKMTGISDREQNHKSVFLSRQNQLPIHIGHMIVVPGHRYIRMADYGSQFVIGQDSPEQGVTHVSETMKKERTPLATGFFGGLTQVIWNTYGLQSIIIGVLDLTDRPRPVCLLVIPKNKSVFPRISFRQGLQFQENGRREGNQSGFLSLGSLQSIYFCPGMANHKVILSHIGQLQPLNLPQPKPRNQGHCKSQTTPCVGPAMCQKSFDFLGNQYSLFPTNSSQRSDRSGRISLDLPKSKSFFERNSDGLKDIIQGLRVQAALRVQSHEPTLQLPSGYLAQLEMSQFGNKIPGHPAFIVPTVRLSNSVSLPGKSTLNVWTGIPIPELREVFTDTEVLGFPGIAEAPLEGFLGDCPGSETGSNLPFLGIQIHLDCQLADRSTGKIDFSFVIPELNVKKFAISSNITAAVDGIRTMPHVERPLWSSDILSDTSVFHPKTRGEDKKISPYNVRTYSMLPRGGLEPPHLAALVPETSVYTNFTTWAVVAKE